MKKILIISFSPVHTDPRVMRQIRLLEHTYDLTVAGYGPAPEAKIQFIQISQSVKNLGQKLLLALKLRLGLYENYYWRLPYINEALQKIANLSYDLIIANDINSLPLALELKKNCKTLLDAHEYSPKEFDNSLVWRLLFKKYNEYICHTYLKKTDGMVTVCQGIADEYYKTFGVKASVVFNAPPYQNMRPTEVNPSTIRLIHHGAAARARHLELMISMMNHLDKRFTLDFMLIETDSSYMAELKSLSKRNSRIRFISPVKMEDICKKLNDYDMGVYILPPDNFNHEHALPNKFFEFIQANLAIAIGPSKEMAAIVKTYACGIIAESFSPQSLATSLNQLTSAEVMQFKTAAFAAARDLNYEASADTLLKKIKELID